ncbi:MAG TPA: HD domain-containing phosphohydrolase [Geminicoccaceae bacterium]|jgi:PAS domain S-box-containing protein|nr:HD domain-containing phosphohydrolase [Geminicoccaceae bacterium]
MAAVRDDPFGGLDLGQQPPRPRPGAFIASSLIALAMIAGLAGVLVKALVDDRRASVHAAQGARMEALARGRAEVIATWVNGIAQTGRRLTEAELLRLFASELALHEPSEPLAQAVAEQLPYLQQMLDDFTRQNGLIGAGLLDLEGRSVLLSSGAPPLRYNPAALLDQRTERWVSPVRAGELDDAVILGARLLMDVALPVPVVQPWLAGEAPEIAAVLFMVVPVAEQLASLLDTKPLLGLGERFRLIQWSEHGSEQVLAGPDPRVVPITLGEALVPGQFRPYGPLTRADGGETFAVGAAVPGVPWTVLHEIDATAALAPLRQFATIALIVAGLAGLALALAFAAFWWRRSNAHERELALQYRDLAAGIYRQRRLLESITNAMREMLCLKTADGRYAYVNPAFADAFGKPVGDIVGRTDVELFGSDVAASAAASDRRTLDGAPVAAETSQLELGGRTRHLSTSKVRLCDETGRTTGLVAVTRDESELVEQRLRHERLIRATVAALIRAVELRDPYLVGHTRRVQCYAALVGERLGLSDSELTTLEIAASLSQVGKIFVPEDILTKAGRLDEEQIQDMRRHVDHALRVIAPIEFELPVPQTIAQMYERLDGSGYPKGLSGDQIQPLARILGVVDVFCALTETRAYRHEQSTGKAMIYLAQHPHRYDVKVVAALAEVLAAEGAAAEEVVPEEARGEQAAEAAA